MAVHGPVRRVLLYGTLFGALFLGAAASGATVTLPSGSASAAAAVPYGKSVRVSKTWFGRAHGARFCRWFAPHGLCVQDVNQSRFCDRHPDHLLCAQAADDGFCEKRPDHPLCDVDRFCREHPDHPLCDDDPPPSPS
jgi:hypothetical protein